LGKGIVYPIRVSLLYNVFAERKYKGIARLDTGRDLEKISTIYRGRRRECLSEKEMLLFFIKSWVGYAGMEITKLTKIKNKSYYKNSNAI
jgi:hypothetical protein